MCGSVHRLRPRGEDRETSRTDEKLDLACKDSKFTWHLSKPKHSTSTLHPKLIQCPVDPSPTLHQS